MSSGFTWTVPSGATTTTSVGDRADQRARLWGRDIWLDITGGNRADTITNHAGDLTIVEGAEALRQAVIRRIITAPGDWALLPNYGAGGRLYIKAKNTQANRDELAERIRAQLLQEQRIERVGQIIVENLEDTPGIKISVQFVPKGATRPEDNFEITIIGKAA